MNPEWAYMILIPLCSFLGMLGGFWKKAFRRFGIPLVIGIVYLLVKPDKELQMFWQLPLALGLLTGALCLPYGSSTNWIVKFLVGCTYPAALLPLGFTWLMVAFPVVFIVMFFLSNWKPTAQVVVWKFWEGTVFGLLGAVAAALCQ